MLLVVAALTSCYAPGPACGDGNCPAGTVCTADREHCVYPEQLTSCTGLADGTACDIRGIDGACRGDICLPIVCGDGFVQPGEEECDGAALGGHTDCLSLGEGYHQAGSLSCTSDCTLDRSTCGDRCGDGITQAPLEACDVTVGTQTCESAGFHGGTLGCKPDCQLDVSSCDGWCGDGLLTSQEECDRTDFGLATCNTYGYYAGTLRCTSACKIAEDQCVGFCGDGIKNGSELCDGEDRPGLSCQTFGWYTGTLACGSDCLSVVESSCSEYCGDGMRNGNELCDGLDHEDISCSSFGAIAGALGCNAFCQPTFNACYWGSFRPAARVAPMGFRTIWASSERDIWGSSDDNHVAHYDGKRWRWISMGIESPVFRFWSSPKGYLWAQTTSGEIAYYDGVTWTIAHQASEGVLVAATTPSDVWLVDYDVMRHFNGSTWSDIPIPGLKTWVNRMHLAEDGSVWLVTPVDILRFDGTDWTVHELGGYPSCIWETGNGDIYTTLWTFTEGGIALRYDGKTWIRVPVPFGVDDVECGWSDGNERIWISAIIGNEPAFVFFEQGTPWLIPASDFDEDNTWAVDGHLWTYDGSDLLGIDGPPWTARTSSTTDSVEVLWISSATSAWVGTEGHVYRTDLDAPLGPFPTDGTVRDIWATNQHVWFAGTFGVQRYISGEFVREDVPPHILSIWGTSDADMWAAGPLQLLHYDGVTWHESVRFPTPGGATFVGRDESNVWLKHGLRDFRYAGGAWNEVQLFSPLSLEATTGPTDHWLVDGLGYVYQHDGVAMTSIKSSWRGTPGSVWAQSPRNVWAIADQQIHRFDGVTWSEVRVPTSGFPSALEGNFNTVWIGGAEGGLHSLPASLPAPYSGACASTLPTYCNLTLRGHTAQTVDGPTDCNGAHAGGELHYKIEVPVTGQLIAEVTSRYDVDLSIVRADYNGGCDVASCVGTAVTDSKVMLDVEQGQTYFLVVGARNEAAPFTLDVDCVKE